MVDLIDFVLNNFTFEYGAHVAAIMLGIIFMICYDFYHHLISAVLSFFRK